MCETVFVYVYAETKPSDSKKKKKKMSHEKYSSFWINEISFGLELTANGCCFSVVNFLASFFFFFILIFHPNWFRIGEKLNISKMNLKCPLCARLSVSIFALHLHCINAHSKEFFTCAWCTVPFASLRALQNHATNCSKFMEMEVK